MNTPPQASVTMAAWGWSGGAMVLGKLPVPGRPTILITVGQGPIALAVGAGGGCLDIFSLIYHFSFLSPSLWETARYRLKYCLKGPLSPKQPANQQWQPFWTPSWISQPALTFGNVSHWFHKLQTIRYILVYAMFCYTFRNTPPSF